MPYWKEGRGWRSRRAAEVLTPGNVGGQCDDLGEMTRHTTFKFGLNPTAEQTALLSRHAGASRFAFNQCLEIVKQALDHRRREANVELPWSGFDLINAFNAWKKTEDAGRVFTVDGDGLIDKVVTGLV